MPLPAVPASTGRLGDLSGVKVKRYEGSVAKSLSIEIVRVVFVLLSDNARAFLQECQCAGGLPTTDRLRTWVMPRLWAAACSRTRARWAELSLSFLWRIEIAVHFNSELNFGKSYKIM